MAEAIASSGIIGRGVSILKQASGGHFVMTYKTVLKV